MARCIAPVNEALRSVCAISGSWMPAQRGLAAPREQVEQQAAGMLAGLVHVDVRIGLEADDHVRIADHRGRHVGMQVERHADGHARRRGAQPHQQVAFAVDAVLRHHRAVQVEQDGVAARRRIDDALRERGVGAGIDRPARVGRGRHRRDQRRAGLFGQVDEGRHRGAHALVVL
jgi:hypothetical protein